MSTIEILRTVNRSLRTRLSRLECGQNHSFNLRPGEFSDLLSEVMQVAECLRCRLPALSEDLELEKELLVYRTNLQKLSELLPVLHTELLIERARLQDLQARTVAATTWAQAQAKTF